MKERVSLVVRRMLAVGLVVASVIVISKVAPVGAQRSGGALPGPVKVAGGLIAGMPGKAPGLTVFKGIPFAAPPVGPNRWRAPQPAATWTGTRAAAAFSASCVQQIVQERKPWTYEFMAHNEVSEDCLYLNVWTPARTPTERRPVFVYIYGGANTEGSAAVPVYDGEGLASKGLVVVTFNYRLGIFGFLAHPELTKESGYHASGNYGLLDQIAAVRWVRDNIAAFGGDPTRITIAGQSAGAQGVHNLTASPLAKGLFHRAVAESGSTVATLALTGRSLADQEADGVRFATAKQAASLAELRAMTWQALFAPLPPAPAANGRAGAAAFRWGPVVDGYALPASIGQIFADGKQNDVPTLTGSNADESGASPQPTATAASFAAQAAQRYGSDAEAFLKLYPAATDADAKIAANTSARDIARVSMYQWAQTRAKTAKTPAFTYFWTHPLPGPDVATYGAFHTSEVPYALNTLSMSDRPFTDTDRRIADTMSSYWVNFATTGDPNGGGLARWPAVAAAQAMTMEIGNKTGAMPVTSTPKALEFLKRFIK